MKTSGLCTPFRRRSHSAIALLFHPTSTFSDWPIGFSISSKFYVTRLEICEYGPLSLSNAINQHCFTRRRQGGEIIKAHEWLECAVGHLGLKPTSSCKHRLEAWGIYKVCMHQRGDGVLFIGYVVRDVAWGGQRIPKFCIHTLWIPPLEKELRSFVELHTLPQASVTRIKQHWKGATSGQFVRHIAVCTLTVSTLLYFRVGFKRFTETRGKVWSSTHDWQM